ncbi:MFS transporter [Candidatus Poriferisodalis sp.]|uniref:MFS transporter n=1 Tax=Candidatus Poriferisodalis sp. TaxID=3101277 RepID=UPI003B02A279
MSDSASEIAARRNSAAASDSRTAQTATPQAASSGVIHNGIAEPEPEGHMNSPVPPVPAGGGGSARGRSDTFASLRVPAFRALWWSGIFSFMSIQMQFLLRSLLAWDLTEREGALGLVYFCFGLALLVSTPLGGVAADRLSKRSLMLVGQLVLTLTAIGMGAAIATGVIRFWMLLISGGLQGLMFGLIGPARISMTTDLVGRERIGNAITLSSLSMSGSRIFAPALAGVLNAIVFFGLAGAYFVSAAIAALSFFLLLPLPDTGTAVSRAAVAAGTAAPVSVARRNPLVDIAEGVRYARARRDLRRSILISTAVIMFGFNYIAFMPALVEDVFDRSDIFVALVSTATALGAVPAAAYLASRADSSAAGSMLIGLGFLFGLTVAGLGGAPTIWVAMLIAVGVGAAATGFMSLGQTLVMRFSDDAHQGRMQSLVQLSFAGFGLAALPVGVFMEWVGQRWGLMTMGAAVTVSMLTYVLTAPRTGRSEVA